MTQETTTSKHERPADEADHRQGSYASKQDQPQSPGKSSSDINRRKSNAQSKDSEEEDATAQLEEQSNIYQDPPPTVVEWLARIGSLLLVGSFITYIVWSALQPEIPTSFKFDADLQNIREEGGRFAVPISITNQGSAAIENITCSVWIDSESDGPPVKKQIDISMLGHGESTDVEVWFDRKPREGQIKFSADSYVL